MTLNCADVGQAITMPGLVGKDSVCGLSSSRKLARRTDEDTAKDRNMSFCKRLECPADSVETSTSTCSTDSEDSSYDVQSVTGSEDALSLSSGLSPEYERRLLGTPGDSCDGGDTLDENDNCDTKVSSVNHFSQCNIQQPLPCDTGTLEIGYRTRHSEQICSGSNVSCNDPCGGDPLTVSPIHTTHPCQHNTSASASTSRCNTTTVADQQVTKEVQCDLMLEVDVTNSAVNGQRQRSLGPESTLSSNKLKITKHIQRSKSFPQMSDKVIFIPIRPSPEQSGLFSCKDNEKKVEGATGGVDPPTQDKSFKRSSKTHQSNPPVARVNPQTNPLINQEQAKPAQTVQQLQPQLHQQYHPAFCQPLYGPPSMFHPENNPYCQSVLYVQAPPAGYYIQDMYTQMPRVDNLHTKQYVAHRPPDNPSGYFSTGSENNKNPPQKQMDNRAVETNTPKSIRETHKSGKSADDALRESSTPSTKRKYKQPLLPDPVIPKYSEMASMTSGTTLESQTAMLQYQQQQQQPFYVQSYTNDNSVFQVGCPSIFMQQSPGSYCGQPTTSVSTPPPPLSHHTPRNQNPSVGGQVSNSQSSSSSSSGGVHFVTDHTGLVIYGPQVANHEDSQQIQLQSQPPPPPQPSGALTTTSSGAESNMGQQIAEDDRKVQAQDNRIPQTNQLAPMFPGSLFVYNDAAGALIAVDASTLEAQLEAVYQQGYLMAAALVPIAGEPSVTSATVNMDNSPATVRMVSSSGPPVPMPMQVPPGHMVQQIVDEHGILTHVILSPQPPGHTAPMTAGPAAGSPFYPSYGASHYVPTPPQYSHHAHPHPVPPHVHGGIPHIPPSSAASTHVPVQSQGEYGASPPLNSTDDRTLRTRNRVRKKLQQRRFNTNEGIYPTQPRPFPGRRNRVNGDIGLHEPSLVQGHCITPENGPIDVEEENSLITQCLNTMPAPKVTDIEARSSLIQLSPPETDCSELDLDPSDFKYELLLSDKGREAKYKTVFCGDATEITLKDLKPATEYHLKVCAVYGDELKGSLTEPVNFTTLQCEPDPPQAPKLLNKTKTSISLKWNATCENGSKITAYLLECDHGLGESNFREIYSGLQRQFRFTRLNASTRYVFRLAAVNSLGRSPYSESVSTFTSGSVPSQPDPPMLSEQFVYALTISWIRRPNDDEFLLQMEDETTGHGFIPVYNGPNLSYMVAKLRRNTEYKFRLAAKNEEGQSKWSETVCYKTLPEKPHPPSKPQIKGKINPYSFRITWDPPSDSGGTEITKYIVELDDGQEGGYDTVYEGSEREHMFDHLTPGHTYRIRVASSSLGGRSDFSECCVATTLPVPPGQCQAPKLQGKPKATSLHLRWGYPDYNGGSQVTTFAAQMISPDNTSREVYKGHDRDCIVAGLLPGRPYLFQVRAFNRAGAGPWSEPLEVVSGAGVPDSPRAPQVSYRSAHSALISWSEPCNNGASITEYRLEWQQKSEPDFTQLYSGPNVSFDAKGLIPATMYTFRVQAINSAGAGQFSAPTQYVTPPSSPSPIVTIKVQANATSAQLTWREPNNNGSDITSYNIDVNDKPLISVEPLTEYRLEDLAPETTYKIRVQAVNGIGVGAFSSVVKCTTKALPPSPPRLECVLPAPTSIKLKWGEGRNPDLLTYTLEMEKEDGSFQPVYTGPAHTHKITRLQELTTYEFRIFASNDAGSGPYSDTYSFTTTKSPPPPLKAPKVHGLTMSGCTLEWPSVKPMGADATAYILQLLCLNGNEMEYKQIYKGPNTQFHIDGLLPNTDYQARVAAVRVSADNTGDIVGAFSPGVLFSPVTPESPKSSVHTSPNKEGTLEETKPWTDQQKAALILCVFVLVCIISAILCQQLISYMSGTEESLYTPVSPSPSDGGQ
uniref:Fibronectin type-III domain-containing protein n=1 Tax=Biomphalaria glabrata TaxID=6526 RepID=A0A2C9KTQ9_BIOGL